MMNIGAVTGVTSDYVIDFAKKNDLLGSESFQSVLDTAMEQIDETNLLQNRAESEEIRFALGKAENTHDLMVAETKASVALQYTVEVRDKIIEAYNHIMQMQV
ncbi:flagellar hook-basal body complex protein FliE [Lachnobacterium bovis DSM 14045]|uniref:Flagellar hook-basal body complex protein FliE n=2 Tax=Lachnobacterium bovis TaxID=140626 RepID=A0A1H3EWD9_9FIRM|nr:flagellar hook-basal body complex protein FliE [Lachnobacterium bovis DSM 14045]